jgi:hypothetical protein
MGQDVTEQTFLRDVREHAMTVLRDDGIYRHLRYKRLDSGTYWFDIVTWPGQLSFSGDMGSFTFSRLRDMFEFFRTDARRPGEGLKINLGYWAEKIQSTEKNGGHEEFSEERFREVVNDYRLRWVRDGARSGMLTKEQRRELWEAVDEDVLRRACDGEYEAFSAAHEFEYKVGKRTYTLDDFWDHNFRDYTVRFVWCCYAIAWSIKLYDAAKVQP